MKVRSRWCAHERKITLCCCAVAVAVAALLIIIIPRNGIVQNSLLALLQMLILGRRWRWRWRCLSTCCFSEFYFLMARLIWICRCCCCCCIESATMGCGSKRKFHFFKRASCTQNFQVDGAKHSFDRCMVGAKMSNSRKNKKRRMDYKYNCHISYSSSSSRSACASPFANIIKKKGIKWRFQ